MVYGKDEGGKGKREGKRKRGKRERRKGKRGMGDGGKGAKYLVELVRYHHSLRPRADRLVLIVV